MTDVVSPEKRSKMMAGIRGKNTKPEIAIRSALHQLGFRFRIHDSRLPGKPDIVLKKYQAIIFIHGCFWHCHQCHLFRWPRTRSGFWKAKIYSNVINDLRVHKKLTDQGWRICVVWECSVKGSRKKEIEEVATIIANWLRGRKKLLGVSG